MRKTYALLIFLCSLIIFSFLKIQPVSFVIYSPPSMDLLLTKTTYAQNELLDGELFLSFSDKFDASAPITLSLGDQSETLTLAEILDSLGYTYTSSEAEIIISSPETEKTLDFTSLASKDLAFSVPNGSQIVALNFDLEGQDPLPMSPSIDLNIDGSIDWSYKGEFSSWSSPLMSDGLDLSKDTSSLYIQGNQYLYCDIIDLPPSDQYNISARYTKEFGADLKATILKFTNKASFVKSDTYCTLPTTPTSEWSSCILNLGTAISGSHLVCVYTTATPSDTTKYFKFVIDGETPTTGYRCDLATTLQGSGACTKTSDLFIKVYTPKYSKEFTSSTFLENIIPSQQTILTSLTSYISTCIEDKCAIPFTVSASGGKLILKNLQLDYSTSDGTFVYSEFYNLDSIEKATISKINDEDIDGQEIAIPLSLFGLASPSIIGESETKELKVTVGSAEDSQQITIYKYGIPAEVSLEKAKTIINNFASADEDTKLILSAYGAEPDAALAKLNDYESQLSSLASSDLTEDVKTQQRTLINAELGDYLNNLPTYIQVKAKAEQQHVSQPSDITDDLLEEQYRNEDMKLEVYNLQTKSNIQSTAINYFVTKYNGVQEEKTLVSKTILNPLGSINIIEKIPKEVASSSDDLVISEDYIVVEKDPTIKFRGSETLEKITYLAPGNVLDKVGDTITLLIPVDLEIMPSIEFECGDDKCTKNVEDSLTCPQDCAKKMPWVLLIVLLVVIIIAVWYFNFYRGEWSLRKMVEKRREKKEEKPSIRPEIKQKKELFKKKVTPRFSTEADHINLRNYISKSLEKNLPRHQINKILLQQGWKQEQIDYIYRELKK